MRAHGRLVVVRARAGSEGRAQRLGERTRPDERDRGAEFLRHADGQPLPLVEAPDAGEVVVRRIDREQDGDRAAIEDAADGFEASPRLLGRDPHDRNGAGGRVRAAGCHDRERTRGLAAAAGNGEVVGHVDHAAARTVDFEQLTAG